MKRLLLFCFPDKLNGSNGSIRSWNFGLHAEGHLKRMVSIGLDPLIIYSGMDVCATASYGAEV